MRISERESGMAVIRLESSAKKGSPTGYANNRQRGRSWVGLLVVLFILGVMLLFARQASAGAVRGNYDMAFDAIWEYGHDWGYYENPGTAHLGRRRFDFLSYGDNGIIDDGTLRLDRTINNWQPIQTARGIGPIRLHDWRNGTTSRGVASGDLYIVNYGGGAVDIEVEYSAFIDRGWWMGLFIDGWLDAWK